MGTQPSSPKIGRSPPIFGPYLLCPNGIIDQNATWYGGRPRPRRHCVRRGSSSPPQKWGGALPQSSARVYCGQTAGWIKMALGMEVSLGPRHIVLDGDPALPKRAQRPHQFWAHVYCGQTAVCMRILLGTEVGLSRGEIVLDGDPAPLPKGAQPPIFGQCTLWPKGWMD